MNELNKSKLFDNIKLILAALAVSICLYFILSFLYKLNVKDEWIYFIILCIGYIVVFIHGVNKFIGFKKRVTTAVSILLMIFFIVFPILVGYFIFYFKIFLFPKKGRFYIWTIILTVVASTTITCFNQTLKYLERRKRSNKKEGKMEKPISKKNDGEVKPKRPMFAPIVFATDEEAAAAGFVPDPAVTTDDIEDSEAVFEDDEAE